MSSDIVEPAPTGPAPAELRRAMSQFASGVTVVTGTDDGEPVGFACPMLDDVLLRVHAEVVDVHVSGDHDVVIGQVLDIDAVSDTAPMVFFRGSFGLEPPVDPRDAIGYVWGWGDHWG